MSRKIQSLIAAICFGLTLLPVCLWSQDADVPLGDIARSYRKAKAPVPAAAAPAIIDNDNISKVMDDVQNKRLKGGPVFSIDSGKNFRMTSPDGTCSLSFDAKVTSLLSDPYVPEELPPSELMKLDGPASIERNTLQLAVYNGTKWNVKEITVGLTIVRHPSASAENRMGAKLIPASEETPITSEKRSDLTVLYHMKGSAAPSVTTTFREALGVALDSDQEWHWAIVQALGIPPKPASAQE